MGVKFLYKARLDASENDAIHDLQKCTMQTASFHLPFSYSFFVLLFAEF